MSRGAGPRAARRAAPGSAPIGRIGAARDRGDRRRRAGRRGRRDPTCHGHRAATCDGRRPRPERAREVEDAASIYIYIIYYIIYYNFIIL